MKTGVTLSCPTWTGSPVYKFAMKLSRTFMWLLSARPRAGTRRAGRRVGGDRRHKRLLLKRSVAGAPRINGSANRLGFGYRETEPGEALTDATGVRRDIHGRDSSTRRAG